MDCIIVPPFVCRAIREGENGSPTKHSVQPITKSSLKGKLSIGRCCDREETKRETDRDRDRQRDRETETEVNGK